jgi:hypothetical protein
MVSDGVGGYHGRAELDLLNGRGREGVQVDVWLVGRVGWDGVGVVVFGPIGHVPLCGSTEGACRVLRPARLRGGSSSVAIVLVVKRIVCAAVAPPTAAPASVRIDSSCPAPPVDYRAG